MRALALLVSNLSSIPWNVSGVEEIAARGNLVHARRNDAVIEADNALMRARWMVLAILDPARYRSYENSFPYLYKDAQERIASVFGVSRLEACDTALILARYLALELSLTRSTARRMRLHKLQRTEIVASAGDECRCWYCGYRFSESTVDRFIEGRNSDAKTPLLVDFITPRGLKVSDMRIEIDHVQPLAMGGVDEVSNMRIACGWCNRRKSSLRLLDEKIGTVRYLKHPTMGHLTIPVPFWSVRIRASHRRCESLLGCDRNLSNSELVVAPWDPAGAMVPGNIAVYCIDHDPYKTNRLVPIRHLRDIKH